MRHCFYRIWTGGEATISEIKIDGEDALVAFVVAAVFEAKVQVLRQGEPLLERSGEEILVVPQGKIFVGAGETYFPVFGKVDQAAQLHIAAQTVVFVELIGELRLHVNKTKQQKRREEIRPIE